MKYLQTHSEVIESFLNYIKNQKEEYNLNLQGLDEEQKITQDILHKLELEKLEYKEQCKLMTILKKNRRNRRRYKDAIEELQPLIDFFNSSEGNKLLKKMNDVLGSIRKVENYHNRRIYIPKSNLEKFN